MSCYTLSSQNLEPDNALECSSVLEKKTLELKA